MSVVLAPEQEELRQGVRSLMEEFVAPRAEEIDAAGEFPEDVRRLFMEHDVFAVVVPPEYGGLDGSLLTLTMVCEEITRVCSNSGMVLGNQSLGSGPIVLHGSEEQKAAILPKLATGEWLCAFALSEPDAGSDAAALQTRARRDGDGWVISGRKNFITGANVADVITVFARLDDSTTAALLVTKDDPGWFVDRIEHKMGLRGSPTCSVVFEEVRVPRSALLGEVGDGLRVALSTLDKGRIMTASMALGIAQGSRVSRSRTPASGSSSGSRSPISRRSSSCLRTWRRTCRLPAPSSARPPRGTTTRTGDHEALGSDEALRHRHGQPRDVDRAPGARRLRVHRRVRRRAPDAGRPRLLDLRGDERDPADRDRARAAPEERMTEVASNALATSEAAGRREILNAATELFSAKGYSRVSIRELAARAGCSTANLYHHFSSKYDIFVTLIEGAMDDHLAGVRQALEHYDDPVEQLESVLRNHLLVHMTRPEVRLLYDDFHPLTGPEPRALHRRA